MRIAARKQRLSVSALLAVALAACQGQGVEEFSDAEADGDVHSADESPRNDTGEDAAGLCDACDDPSYNDACTVVSWSGPDSPRQLLSCEAVSPGDGYSCNCGGTPVESDAVDCDRALGDACGLSSSDRTFCERDGLGTCWPEEAGDEWLCACEEDEAPIQEVHDDCQQALFAACAVPQCADVHLDPTPWLFDGNYGDPPVEEVGVIRSLRSEPVEVLELYLKGSNPFELPADLNPAVPFQIPAEGEAEIVVRLVTPGGYADAELVIRFEDCIILAYLEAN